MSSIHDQPTPPATSYHDLHAYTDSHVGSSLLANDVELLNDTNDWDSACGDDYSSRSQSVRSSVYDYPYENGRRYHAYRKGQYILPNDEREQERLDLHHHIWRLVSGGKLYSAPLPPLRNDCGANFRILDLGCGTGLWAIEMADEFPNTQVLGIDLSPIQPEWVPCNCKFYVDDYESQWSFYEDENFDFIHGRALCGTLTDWLRFYHQAKHNLKPGGWFEMKAHDCWVYSDDDSCDRAPWTMEWLRQLDGASRKFGKQINVGQQHRQWMIDAGFTDVEERVYRVPIGPWAADPKLKELGHWQQIHMQMLVESYTPALFSRVLNYSGEQIRIMMERVKSELRSRDLKLITNYRFIVGRKAS